MKYSITNNYNMVSNHIVFQIQCEDSFTLIDGTRINKGDLGGWVENRDNLSQEGQCWILDNAIVTNAAKVYGNAIVSGNAHIVGHAQVYDNARVCDDAEANGSSTVYGNAQVKGNAKISMCASVYGDAIVFNNAGFLYSPNIYGNSRIGRYYKDELFVVGYDYDKPDKNDFNNVVIMDNVCELYLATQDKYGFIINR